MQNTKTQYQHDLLFNEIELINGLIQDLINDGKFEESRSPHVHPFNKKLNNIINRTDKWSYTRSYK